MTANRGPKRTNRRRADATGQSYQKAQQERRREQSLAEMRALLEQPVPASFLWRDDAEPASAEDDSHEDDADYDGMWVCEWCSYMPEAGETRCPNRCEDFLDRLRDERHAREAAEAAHRCYQQSPVPAAEFLALLEQRPRLMPRARPTVTAADIDARRALGLACLRCGQPAACAYGVQHKEHGSFWLDLCPSCVSAVGVYGS